MKETYKVGIFIFNDVEVLDFAGPYEVFSISKKDGKKIFDVKTVAENNSIVKARNGLQVLPDTTISDDNSFDILIIPGGKGVEYTEINNQTVLNWIKSQDEKVKILASVCTGALLLAECGILKNKKATTHWLDLKRLKEDYPDTEVIEKTKFVDEGNVITAAGISAGINMSFHIVSKLCGVEVAKETAEYMEYDINL